MTPRENLAAALNVANLQYPEEPSKDLIEAAKQHRLVIIFGGSDDLMEFRGAVYDEIGAWEGTIAYFDSDGLLQNDCDNEECPAFARRKQAAQTVRAIWSPESEPDLSWAYETALPHSTFEVHEDGHVYCRGIVISLDDVRAAASVTS